MPVADEVWRLQRGDDAECRFFQGFASQGHYRGGGTRQGIYAVAPSGRLLGSLNSLNPEAVAKTLQSALERWNDLPDEERYLDSLSKISPRHRWESSYPSDGLVLRITKRDLPDSLDPSDPRGPGWNRDHAWFRKEEARAWLPEKISVGAVHPLPEVIAHRLIRFHVVDNVIGQTLPFAPQEVIDSSLETSILSVDGSSVSIEIHGETAANADGIWLLGKTIWTPNREWPRGIRASYLGRAVFDRDAGRFTRFEMVAHAYRFGMTGNNGRWRSPEPGYIGVSFEIASDTAAERVPPAFVDLYNADWIEKP